MNTDTKVRQCEAGLIRFIDLFCGIGGFHVAIRQALGKRKNETECVFASDIDADARESYAANYGLTPFGDITKIDAEDIPEHDMLFAGFPCQAFSIIGKRQGFKDQTKGTLFFDICRILSHHKPDVFVLENVKQLSTHDKGNTIRTIDRALEELGYHCDRRVLNALDFGLPQKRERTFIVGFKSKVAAQRFAWPQTHSERPTLGDILERDVLPKYFASEHIRQRRIASVRGRKSIPKPAVWHENKGGNISPLPYSCALRAFASHNYLLVDGIRRFTEREMLRLQGFPEDFKILGSYNRTKKQTGNSIPVPAARAILQQVFKALDWAEQKEQKEGDSRGSQ